MFAARRGQSYKPFRLGRGDGHVRRLSDEAGLPPRKVELRDIYRDAARRAHAQCYLPRRPALDRHVTVAVCDACARKTCARVARSAEERLELFVEHLVPPLDVRGAVPVEAGGGLVHTVQYSGASRLKERISALSATVT